MSDVVLPRTSLCAIVRDEMMNPAGGIMRFLRSVIPHVEKAVIVDTGSIDGTRDALEDAKREFSNLYIYDTEFRGYAEARNFSLSKLPTPMALILDADEIIKQEDYEKIKKGLEYTFKRAGLLKPTFYFGFIDVIEQGEHEGCGHPERIVNAGSIYSNVQNWKWEYVTNSLSLIPDNLAKVYHFRPEEEAKKDKIKKWYDSISIPVSAPSHTPGFSSWKRFNPARNKYKASDLDVPDKEGA